MRLFSSSDGQIVRVVGCEPILSVDSNSSFTLRLDEYINPLNAALFPKLSQEAALYDQFRFKRIGLEYYPRCSSTTAGQVGLLLLPDSHTSEQPADIIELERYEHSCSSPPWQGCSTEASNLGSWANWLFMAPAAEFASAAMGTKRTQSAGVAQVGVSDGSATPALYGHVYVSYEVEMRERRPAYVSGLTVNLTTTNTTGTGSPTYLSIVDALAQVDRQSGGANPNITLASDSIYGYPHTFLSRLWDTLVGITTGSSTPSYIAALGLSAALGQSAFVKLHGGGLPNNLFLNWALGAKTTPMVGVGRGTPCCLSKPLLRREESKDYRVISKGKEFTLADNGTITAWDFRSDGAYVQYDGEPTWYLYEQEELKSPLTPDADGDYAIVQGHYRPLTDVTTTATVFTGSTTSAVSGSYSVKVTNSNADPIYLVWILTKTIASGSSRTFGGYYGVVGAESGG